MLFYTLINWNIQIVFQNQHFLKKILIVKDKTEAVTAPLHAFRIRRRRLKAAGQRQPEEERKDRWILVGSVLFSCVHFGCAFVSACFVAISQNTEEESTQDVLYKIGMLVTFSSAIISIILFFIGNYQFRLSMLKLLKKLFCFFTPTAAETTVVRTRIFVTPPAPLENQQNIAAHNSVNTSVITDFGDVNTTNSSPLATDLSSMSTLHPYKSNGYGDSNARSTAASSKSSFAHLASEPEHSSSEVRTDRIIGSGSTNEVQEQRQRSNCGGVSTEQNELSENSAETVTRENKMKNKANTKFKKSSKPQKNTKGPKMSDDLCSRNTTVSDPCGYLGLISSRESNTQSLNDSAGTSNNNRINPISTPEIVITDENGAVLWRFSKRPLACLDNSSNSYESN